MVLIYFGCSKSVVSRACCGSGRRWSGTDFYIDVFGKFIQLLAYIPGRGIGSKTQECSSF
ncbi:MAG: hypothetical protein IPO07_29625 [Haliscomenobacter sp.]|nr:hypothetical protein [Haliscomenobacter sp.]MBK9492490.1 hypothetical protein [Haliscomenobacter sp.]